MVWLWAGFGIIVVFLLVLDLFVFHKGSHVDSIRAASGWTVFWIAVGLLFTVPVYFLYEHHTFGIGTATSGSGTATSGAEAVILYLTGYVLEKSLSVDNILVMAVIFESFGVMRQYRHRVLFWGILGAIVARAAMIFGGIWLLKQFAWLFYVFGAYLVFVGIKILVEKETKKKVEDRLLVRTLKKFLPIDTRETHDRFTIRVEKKRYFTMLFLALVVVELTDIVFAIDSVPAVLAVTTDPFIVLTSNVFAILGLRSLYFVLDAVIQKFAYIKYALAALLVFIGIKMIIRDVLHIPTVASLLVILALVGSGVLASLVKLRRDERRATGRRA